jgi:hypothetical protein
VEAAGPIAAVAGEDIDDTDFAADTGEDTGCLSIAAGLVEGSLAEAADNLGVAVGLDNPVDAAALGSLAVDGLKAGL